MPFGVLEADSNNSAQFDDAGANFLAGLAGLLGFAIERQHAGQTSGRLRPRGLDDARDESSRRQK